ncbi:MAG: hypothetical protein ACO3PX_11270, partial [bacterium]
LTSPIKSIIIKLLASCLESGDFQVADFSESPPRKPSLKGSASLDQPPLKEVSKETQCPTINILNSFQ